MTDEQLKQYIVKYRKDEATLSAYFARRHHQNHPTIANVKDAEVELL